MSASSTVRARVTLPEHGIVAGDLLVVERASAAEAGDLVVDAGGSVRRFAPGMGVLGRVLWVFGARG